MREYHKPNLAQPKIARGLFSSWYISIRWIRLNMETNRHADWWGVAISIIRAHGFVRCHKSNNLHLDASRDKLHLDWDNSKMPPNGHQDPKAEGTAWMTSTDNRSKIRNSFNPEKHTNWTDVAVSETLHLEAKFQLLHLQRWSPKAKEISKRLQKWCARGREMINANTSSIECKQKLISTWINGTLYELIRKCWLDTH